MAENMWHELVSKRNRKVRHKIREMPHIFCGLCANVLEKWCTIKFQPFRFFFFLWCCGPTRVMAFSHVRFLDHTQRRTTAGGIPPNEWSARRRNLWQHTTLTKDRHPCPDGIQTHNPSRRVGAGLRLRRRGHWERPTVLVGVENTNRQ